MCVRRIKILPCIKIANRYYCTEANVAPETVQTESKDSWREYGTNIRGPVIAKTEYLVLTL
jgi:hypothetical protein